MQQLQPQPRVAFHTLGCKVNAYDTESLWQLFRQAGYQRVDFSNEADVYVINTCTVTNTGDSKSRQIIRRAINKNPEAVVVVTGCYAQTSATEVAAIPGVDIVIGTSGREQLLAHIDRFHQERQPLNLVTNVFKARQFEELDTTVFEKRTRALLKIQEGCNNFCTFCIIPWARGFSRSRAPENVLAQARKLVVAGYKEIVLTGIHTGGYGEDLDNYSLVDLLRDLEQVDGLARIRISSIEASQVTDGLIELLQHSAKICRHLHIPLQAGSDEVLQNMKRRYTLAEYASTLDKLQAKVPDLSITTDVITGFPQESDEQFASGYKFIAEAGFFQLHVFPYSQRRGTKAAAMSGQIAKEVKEARVEQLISLSQRLSEAHAQKFFGQVLEVIPEQAHGDEGLYIGYTDNYLRCIFPATEHEIGRICKLKIESADGEYCRGTLVKQASTVAG